MTAVGSNPTHPCPRCGKTDWYETTETRPQKGFNFSISHQTFYVWSCRNCGEKLLDAKVEKLKKPIKGLKYYGLYLTLGGAFWVVYALASGATDEIFLALGVLAVGLLLFKRGRTDNSRRR